MSLANDIGTDFNQISTMAAALAKVGGIPDALKQAATSLQEQVNGQTKAVVVSNASAVDHRAAVLGQIVDQYKSQLTATGDPGVMAMATDIAAAGTTGNKLYMFVLVATCGELDTFSQAMMPVIQSLKQVLDLVANASLNPKWEQGLRASVELMEALSSAGNITQSESDALTVKVKGYQANTLPAMSAPLANAFDAGVLQPISDGLQKLALGRRVDQLSIIAVQLGTVDTALSKRLQEIVAFEKAMDRLFGFVGLLTSLFGTLAQL